MNKKMCVLAGVMFLAAALLFVPVVAQAEMYVEGYIGGSATSSDAVGIDVSRPGFGIATKSFGFPGNFDNPTVIGGVKVGTWFVKEGFLGFNYPEWMKYFGFYTDFSYQNLNMRNQNGVVLSGPAAAAAPFAVLPATMYSEGSAATWAFMFAARYGFFPDSEVPFGRLQPYVAVGPAILFSSQQPKINEGPGLGGYGLAGNNAGATNIALAVDAGVRWMCLKNVSIDVSFKYRWAEPTYDFTFHDNYDGSTHSFSMSPTLNMFSGQVGAAYHF